MLNLDVKKANDGPMTHFPEGGPHIGEQSDEELIHSHSNYNNKKELILPNVVHPGNFGRDNSNMSVDNIKEGSGDENDPFKPKM